MKFLHHKFFTSTERWYPLLAVYYLTYRCSFRCSYCSDGSGRPYYALPDSDPGPDRAVEVLRAIRARCRHLVLTGGEPLEHPRFREVLASITSLGFSSVILTTNGLALDEYLEEMAKAVSTLVVSVDTLDSEKACSIMGVDARAFGRILENLDRAARLPGRRFDITVSSVLMPETLEDQYALMSYCRERGITYAACPRLAGVRVDEGLEGNEAYRELYRRMIGARKSGQKIFGTVPYLSYMGDLKEFRCDPFTMLTVSPGGGIFYPCLEKGRVAASIGPETDLHALRKEASERFGPLPHCGRQCHSACALGFSVSLTHTMATFMDSFFSLKGRLNGAQ